MAGTTPSEPPPDGDLMFPAVSDGAWRPGTISGSQHRGVVVAAAVATLVVVGVAVLVALRVLSGATGGGTDVAGPGTAASIGDVAVGACYRLNADDRTGDSVGEVEIVACATPHDGQVYATVPLAYDDYPGDAELSTAADAGCGAHDAVDLDRAVRDVDTISTSWYAPLEADWHDSEHRATCVIESDAADALTRSWTVAATA